MRPSTENRLFSLGCLFVFIGVCVSGYLALSNRVYWIVVAGLIGGWLLVSRRGQRLRHRRHLEALRAAFGSSERLVPHLEEGNHYGFPAFKLTFASEAELRHAEESGRIAAFKESIQSLYAHVGSKQNPFNAEWAVSATYEGWKPDVTRK
jgi:hypothetical protein